MKKFLVPILVILVLACGALYFSNKTPPLKTTQTSTITSSPKTTLEGLEKNLQIEAQLRPTTDWDFLNNDGTHTPLNGLTFVVGTSGMNGMGKYGSLKEGDLNAVSESFINKLATTVNQYFISQGFTQNTKNTNMKPNEYNSIRLGYEKENQFCVVNLTINSDPYGIFVCGEPDVAQTALQNQFASLVDPKESLNNPNYLFRVEKVDGDYAFGTISNMIGAGWFAKKENGEWKMLFKTPDMPSCEEVDKYQIPPSIYQNCYTSGDTFRFPIPSTNP